MKRREGLIIRGIGGFYSVQAAGAVYECKARGLFRKNGVTPFVGDRVVFSAEPDGTGFIEEILPRRNVLIRPPIANIDQLVIVVSVREPEPNTLVIDKMLAAAYRRGIRPVLVVSKLDLQGAQWLSDIYGNTGIPCHTVSSVTGEGTGPVRDLLNGKITAFTGNSGVGKSSLLNRIAPQLSLPTGEISAKLGRGRHTTRRVELLRLDENTYVADTPGFSAIRMEGYDGLDKEALSRCFPEFEPYLGQCRFSSCSHTREKGCAVLEAVKNGRIHPSRHRNYVAMYQEMKDLKNWNRK